MIDIAHPSPALGATLTVLTALTIDAAVGDPPAVWRRVGHPVVWIGRAIAAADRRMNRDCASAERRKTAGVVVAVALCAGAAVIGVALSTALAAPFGWVVVGALCTPFLAQRSLFEHVDAVRAPLAAGDDTAARRALSMIVGRDLDAADPGAMAGAAIESLAESWSDGIGAPLFWFALLGPAGLLAYKAVNTADSMIGHRTPRHAAFGWAAARLDDAMNWIPARATGAAYALAAYWTPGASPGGAVAAARRDAPKHRSPNAGWPEAACAGALGLRIGGPRAYAGVETDEPYMGAAGRPPGGAADLGAALRLTKRAAPPLWLAGIALAALIGWG